MVTHLHDCEIPSYCVLFIYLSALVMYFMDLFNFCYLVTCVRGHGSYQVEFDCVCFNVFVSNLIYLIWFDYIEVVLMCLYVYFSYYSSHLVTYAEDLKCDCCKRNIFNLVRPY